MRIKCILLAVAVFALASCGLSTQDQASLNASVQQAQAELHTLQTQLHDQQVASTQPNATQPAPPADAVKVVDALTKKVDQLSAAVANIPPNANPGQIVQAAAPLAGPYAGWVGLAGTLLTLGWGLFQKNGKDSNAAALKTTTDGLHAAISTGAITVSPQAPAIVNAAVTDHPATDRVVDILSDAAKTPRID